MRRGFLTGVGLPQLTVEQDHRSQPHHDNRQAPQCCRFQHFIGSIAVSSGGESVEVEGAQHERGREFFHHIDKHQQQRSQEATPQQRNMHGVQGLRGAFAKGAAGFVHAGSDVRQPRFCGTKSQGEKAGEVCSNENNNVPLSK